MARRPSQRARLLTLLDRFEPELRRAFLEGIDEITSRAEIGLIAELLERGDIEGALRAVHVDPIVFRELEEAIRRAYRAGGSATTALLPPATVAGARVVIRFDARNPRAETWLTVHSSNLVTAIVDDQRTAIRAALRAGMEAGANPRTTALDIVGRINRETGRREGGIVGLTAGQEESVRRARGELSSTDPAELRNYLTRTRRDKRFDRAVVSALANGTSVPAETVSRAAQAYSNSLLKLRGDTISRTESLASLHAAQREAFEQAVGLGSVRPEDVRRIWRTAGDNRVRDSHRALEGESVGLDERFSNGLLFPGESGGAPGEIINCRCVLDIRVDFLANIGRG